MVYAAVGVHPHNAENFERDADGIHTLLRKEKVVAVGEIGLDYSRELVSRDVQRHAFDMQLAWAREFDLPVSVHNRDANEDTLRAASLSGARVVLHCFSSHKAFAVQALAAGFVLSFAGTVTFPRSHELRDVVAFVPDDSILVETDSPVLAPQRRRGKRNEPAWIRDIVESVAAARSASVESVADGVSRNADSLFHWGVS